MSIYYYTSLVAFILLIAMLRISRVDSFSMMSSLRIKLFVWIIAIILAQAVVHVCCASVPQKIVGRSSEPFQDSEVLTEKEDFPHLD